MYAKFRRALDGSGWINNGYKRLTRNRKGVYQHRLVWEAANGTIPNGYHIHHVDGDKLNNKLTNLQSLSASDHHKLHWKKGKL